MSFCKVVCKKAFAFFNCKALTARLKGGKIAAHKEMLTKLYGSCEIFKAYQRTAEPSQLAILAKMASKVKLS